MKLFIRELCCLVVFVVCATVCLSRPDKYRTLKIANRYDSSKLSR